MDLSTLMRRIQQGDREAFATLYTRYNKTVYRIALDATHDSEEAVQVVKAVFREMYQTIRSKGPYLGDLYGWLDALTAKQIRLRRLTRGTTASLRNAPAADAVPRSYSANESEALQERVLARMQRNAAAQPPRADTPEKPAQAQVVPLPVREKSTAAQKDSSGKKQPPSSNTKQKVGKKAGEPDKTRQKAAEAQRKHSTKSKHMPLEEELDECEADDVDTAESHSGGTVSVILLSLTALALLWVLIGLLGTLEILPKWPLGYAWFNETLFELF